MSRLQPPASGEELRLLPRWVSCGQLVFPLYPSIPTEVENHASWHCWLRRVCVYRVRPLWACCQLWGGSLTGAPGSDPVLGAPLNCHLQTLVSLPFSQLTHPHLWNKGLTVADFIFWGSKITADGDCSLEIKRCLLLGRKVMTNLDSILKSRNITLSTKVRLVKAMVFPVVTFDVRVGL